MDETMLGESSRGARLHEREHKQHIREATNQIVFEGGLKIKEEELLLVTTGDIHPNSEIPLTLRRSSWRQYIPSWGTPTQLPTIITHAPQAEVPPKTPSCTNLLSNSPQSNPIRV